MIKLMICEDHALMRAGLLHALQADERFRVVAQAQDRAQLLQWLATEEEADILLLDLSLDELGVAAGIDLVQDVRRQRPALPIVVVSMHDDAEVVGRAMQAGAKGYVNKASSLQVLTDAILQVHRGHHFLAPDLVEPMVRQQTLAAQPWSARLTARESEVLRLICRGQRLSQIAADWGVSVKTVSTHKVRLMEKLHLTSNADLIKFGLRNGLG